MNKRIRRKWRKIVGAEIAKSMPLFMEALAADFIRQQELADLFREIAE